MCRSVSATSLEELVAALGFSANVYPDLFLDGEPAVRIDKSAYEPPAQGGQHLTYVFAMHEGRPLVLRCWTSRGGGPIDLDEILLGFRFLD